MRRCTCSVRKGDQWSAVTAGGITLKARTPATTPAIALEPGAATPRILAVVSRAPLPTLAQTGAALTAALEQMRAETGATPPLTDASGGSTFAVSSGRDPWWSQSTFPNAAAI